MKRRQYSSFLVIMLISMFFVAASGPAHSQFLERQRFDDWSLRCELAPGSPRENCILSLTHLVEEWPSFTIELIYFRLIDGSKTLLRVSTPRGVWLRRPVELHFSNGYVAKLAFERCGGLHCFAETVVSRDLLLALARSTSISAKLHRDPDLEITSDIALSKTTEGLRALHQINQN